MSVESAFKFVIRTIEDKEFDEKVQNYSNPEVCKAFVEGAGYCFTLDEYNEARNLIKSSDPVMNVRLQLYYLCLFTHNERFGN